MSIMPTETLQVLIIEDDWSQSNLLAAFLETRQYQVHQVPTAKEALDCDFAPHFILLDLNLPDIDGLRLSPLLRERFPSAFIVMLTARQEEIDRIVGLESGADDYVMKPFKPKELVARVRARLRRNEDEPAEMLSIGDIEIDVPAHKVTRAGEQISLTPLEFDLLVALARKPRQVFTRDVLLEQVWGYRHPADTRLVNVHVQRLRAKVEKDPENPQVVLTVRGVGYKAGPP